MSDVSGRKHMIIGTAATITIAVVLLIKNIFSGFDLFIPMIAGGIIGSYMPDIDAQRSTAAQTFNKVLTVLITAMAMSYTLGLVINVDNIMKIFKVSNGNLDGVIVFAWVTLLGKLSPHRMFTHKWLGTIMFCGSSFMIGSQFFGIGFTIGYLLHIICDRFSRKGKFLRFFQFKLPCKNYKNKTVINW